MTRVASSPFPTTVTAAQLAHALGIAERNVMSRKMDGRLLTAEDGRIDLGAILRAGVNSLARRPGTVSIELDEDAFDAALRTAAHASIHLLLTKIVAARPGADPGTVAAEALREALDLFGLAGTAEAPIPARLEPLAIVA